MELLNAQPSGIPLYKITIKMGSPLVLLRNHYIMQGLSNGTKLIAYRIGKHILQAEISIGG